MNHIYKIIILLIALVGIFFAQDSARANYDNLSCSGNQGYVDGTACSQNGSVWWRCSSDRCFAGSTECVYRYDFRSCGHWVSCPKCPNNPPCVPGNYGNWGNCTKTCGGGTQSRSNGCASQTQMCNTQPCLNFTGEPLEFTFIGGTSKLSWSTIGATSCIASGGWDGSVGISGSNLPQSIPVNNTSNSISKIFSMECKNGNLTSGVQSLTVTTTPPPLPKITLSVSDPILTYKGGLSTISWSTTDATRCQGGDAIAGRTELSGIEKSSFESNITKSNKETIYTMECWNSANVSSGLQTVKVTVTKPPSPSLSLTASSRMVPKGTNAKISWVPVDAFSCTASGAWPVPGAKDVTGGYEDVLIDVFKTFSMECKNVADESTGLKTVNVCFKTDCAKDTCIGKTCPECDTTGIISALGLKDCRDQNWQEVSPE